MTIVTGQLNLKRDAVPGMNGEMMIGHWIVCTSCGARPYMFFVEHDEQVRFHCNSCKAVYTFDHAGVNA